MCSLARLALFEHRGGEGGGDVGAARDRHEVLCLAERAGLGQAPEHAGLERRGAHAAAREGDGEAGVPAAAAQQAALLPTEETEGIE